nr:phenylacetic acid degradation protein PaaY [Pseudomonadota bacterium]
MSFYRIDGFTPVVHPSAYVHPSAQVIGDVVIGVNCYIGPCAVLRGDFGRIQIDDNANIQDTCVMHAFPNLDCRVRSHGHVGHGSVLHGCDIGVDAMIGINAVVLDGARIGARAIVGACAMVLAQFEVPEQTLVVGVPAKVKRL